MGLYIKGAEMPKTCTDCPCYYYRDGDNDGYTHSRDGCSALHVQFNEHVYWGANIHNPFKGRYENCPLVEVPEPHGRLIDADALLKIEDALNIRVEGVHVMLVDDVRCFAPTVIEGSK